MAVDRQHCWLLNQLNATKPPSQSDIYYPSLSDSSTAYVSETRRDPRPDPLQQLNKGKIDIQGTATGFRQRRFPLRWNQKRQDTHQDVARGPFGLRLLHASPQPLVDIVFVHGLRGGSSKTWRKGDDPILFWPQHWLPLEPDLRNASIHSFGYDSDWGSSNPSVLNVHDFGQTLYEELRSSPYLRQNPDSPIIMVGHSMGGLVIKKAYVAAHQDQTYCQLAERMRCIFFLATPHRGSEYASILNRILKISGITGITSSREYINEISLGSISAQLINEDFGRYASTLQVYSFYETLETSLGLFSALIVDKESAVLGPGFRNEIARYMNANHRGICKFDSPEDPNYISLKNSLSSAVQNLLQESRAAREETSKTQLRGLQTSLGILAPPDDNHDILEGSCQWIADRDDFRGWRDAEADTDSTKNHQHTPSVYWVTAHPGAGKTFLAAHVVSHLAELNLSPAFYHFDTRTVTPQYWIFDAIDECLSYPDLFTFLKGLTATFPLKIFITSRKVPDFPKLVHQLHEYDVHVVEIPTINTMQDISLYIRDRMHVLPIDRDEDKETITKEILSRSNASFLWVRVVLDELEGVYGYESIISVLHNIPEGMVPYYHRSIAEMSKNKRERYIIRAILTWVVCASRPLTVLELTEAIRTDINVNLPSPKTAVESLCGHFVSVDKQTALVQIVHATAREFLLSDEAEPFRISIPEANERLALSCLQLLASPTMKRPKHRRLLAQKRQAQPNSPMLDYAITQFSEHILHSSAESDKVIVALSRFLCATVLGWVEKVAARENLRYITRVAGNLKAFIDRKAQYSPSPNQHVMTVACWVADLSRLATKFGRALMLQPYSIYFLVPPLCPRESAIYRQFGRSHDGLTLSGFINEDWDDCTATVSFENDTAATVTCDDRHVAIGFDSGNIQLYTHGSYQTGLKIRLIDPIDHLLLDSSGQFIVAASIKYVAVWDLDGNALWQNRLRSRCILLTASSSLVICVMMSGKAIWWDVATGEQLDLRHYPHRAPKSPSGTKAPFTGSFNPTLELVALGYQTGPICIYELQTHEWIGWVADSISRGLTHLEFNPNPDVDLLLVAYDDSQLSLYDPWSGTLIHSQKPETDVILQSLSSSPDGRTFATTDTQGNLRIWNFESLAVLYHVLTPPCSFRTLSFTADGINVLDVGNHEMRVWTPPIMDWKPTEEEGGIEDQVTILPVTAGRYYKQLRSMKLRVVISHDNKPILISGNYNGEVTAYDQDGDRNELLYSHPNSIVKCLALSKSDVIASSDTNGVVQVWQLDTSQLPVIRAANQEFQVQLKTAVLQLLFDDEGRYLLVCTRDMDRVYEVATGVVVGSLSFHTDERQLWRWTSLPGSATPSRFVLVCDGKVMCYSAENFPSEAADSKIKIQLKADTGFSLTAIESIVLHPETSSMMIDITQNRGFLTTSILFVFRIPELFSPKQLEISVEPIRVLTSDFYIHFLGIDQSDCKLVFVEGNSWVCSVKLSELTNTHYTRHFFVPNECTLRAREIRPLLTAENNLVFALHDKFAVIKNGLVFQEMVTQD
ncbi:NACHT and WD domain protein [Nemania serpens]|nr:NACHT and WD domain protein [Nemania serpens]